MTQHRVTCDRCKQPMLTYHVDSEHICNRCRAAARVDPTPEQIAAACAEIQSGWTDLDRERRTVQRCGEVEVATLHDGSPPVPMIATIPDWTRADDQWRRARAAKSKHQQRKGV